MTLGRESLVDADMAVQFGWVAAVSGAALAADLDHPEAGASRMWGPVSQVASTAINTISGGHRQGTHDVVLASTTSTGTLRGGGKVAHG